MQDTLRSEMKDIIMDLSDDQLTPALIYLRDLSKVSKNSSSADKIVQRILEEDSELLKKLAQ